MNIANLNRNSFIAMNCWPLVEGISSNIKNRKGYLINVYEDGNGVVVFQDKGKLEACLEVPLTALKSRPGRARKVVNIVAQSSFRYIHL